VVLGLIGLGATATGGWWVVTGHWARRVVGAAAVVLGVVLQVVALLHAGDGGWASVLRLVVTLVMVVVAIGAARAALAAALAVARARRGPADADGHARADTPGIALQPVVGRREGREVRH
jgi:hypothetical protein